MNKELLFAQTLEKVRNLAKEQGNCVSEEQVKEAFESLDLNDEQLQMVFDYLVKHKVGIGQPVNMDDYLTDEESKLIIYQFLQVLIMCTLIITYFHLICLDI